MSRPPLEGSKAEEGAAPAPTSRRKLPLNPAQPPAAAPPSPSPVPHRPVAAPVVPPPSPAVRQAVAAPAVPPPSPAARQAVAAAVAPVPHVNGGGPVNGGAVHGAPGGYMNQGAPISNPPMSATPSQPPALGGEGAPRIGLRDGLQNVATTQRGDGFEVHQNGNITVHVAPEMIDEVQRIVRVFGKGTTELTNEQAAIGGAVTKAFLRKRGELVFAMRDVLMATLAMGAVFMAAVGVITKVHKDRSAAFAASNATAYAQHNRSLEADYQRFHLMNYYDSRVELLWSHVSEGIQALFNKNIGQLGTNLLYTPHPIDLSGEFQVLATSESTFTRSNLLSRINIDLMDLESLVDTIVAVDALRLSPEQRAGLTRTKEIARAYRAVIRSTYNTLMGSVSCSATPGTIAVGPNAHFIVPGSTEPTPAVVAVPEVADAAVSVRVNQAPIRRPRAVPDAGVRSMDDLFNGDGSGRGNGRRRR